MTGNPHPRPAPSNDKQFFHVTAKKTKSVNVKPTMSKGGTRL